MESEDDEEDEEMRGLLATSQQKLRDVTAVKAEVDAAVESKNRQLDAVLEKVGEYLCTIEATGVRG